MTLGRLGLILTIAALVASAGVLASSSTSARGGLAMGAPTPPPAFRPSSAATAVPASALVPTSNPALGYIVKLLPGYRRAASSADTQNTGVDLYTPRSDQEDRALCAREQPGETLVPDRVADLKISVSSNPGSLSAAAFASTPQRRLPFTAVQATTINGNDAAKIVHQPSGDTAYYVVAASGKIYELAPLILEQPSTQPRGWLDEIASTFSGIPPQTVTTATPGKGLCAP